MSSLFFREIVKENCGYGIDDVTRIVSIKYCVSDPDGVPRYAFPEFESIEAVRQLRDYLDFVIEKLNEKTT